MFQVRWSLQSSTTAGDRSFRKRTFQASFDGNRQAHRDFDFVAKEIKKTEPAPPAPATTAPPRLPAPTRQWAPIKPLVKAEVLEVSESDIVRLADLHAEISASGAETSDMEADKSGGFENATCKAVKPKPSAAPAPLGNRVPNTVDNEKSASPSHKKLLPTPSLDSEFDAMNTMLQTKLDKALRALQPKRPKKIKAAKSKWPFPAAPLPGGTSDDSLSLETGRPADHVPLDQALIGCIGDLCDVDTDDDDALLADLLKDPL